MDKRDEARSAVLGALSTSPPASLFRDPIEYLFADHFRQRSLCSVLDQLTQSQKPDRELVDAALAFLRGDFGVHVLDEEEDLFPLLMRRVEPEDKIEEVLRQLSDEHASEKEDAEQIISILESLKSQRDLGNREKALLTCFAANERQHLMVENAIVLPLARARLRDTDMETLAMRMAERRGTNLSQVAND